MINHQANTCVHAIPSYKQNTIVPIQSLQTTPTPLPFDFVDIYSGGELCVLDNGDIMFRVDKFLRRYFASNRTVIINLGKGSSTEDGVDSAQVSAYVSFVGRTPQGECAFVDSNSKKIRVISNNDNTVRTILQLSTVISYFSFDDNENMLFTDSTKVMKVNMTGGYMNGNITVIAGTSKSATTATIPVDGSNATTTSLKNLASVLSINGTVYFSTLHAIMKIENEELYRVSGSWASCTYNTTYTGLAINACLNFPKLLIAYNNEIYFGDKAKYTRKINKNGFIEMVAGLGSSLSSPLRTDQKLESLTDTFISIQIVNKNGNVTFYISTLSRILQADQDRNVRIIVGRAISFMNKYSVFKYGLGTNQIMKIFKIFKNGDFLVILKSDPTILWKLPLKTGILEICYKLDLPFNDAVVDKSTGEDIFIVNSNSTIYYFRKFNLYTKRIETIAGTNAHQNGYQYDGQSSLDVAITGFKQLKYFNGSLYYSTTDQYLLIQIDLSTLTVKKIMGVGYPTGQISGLNSDLQNVEATFNDMVSSDPYKGNLFFRLKDMIVKLDDQNKVIPYVGKVRPVAVDMFDDYPASADKVTFDSNLPMVFHPITKHLFFIEKYNSILEYVNSTYVRRVVRSDGSSVTAIAFRKNGNLLYTLSNTNTIELNITSGNSTIISNIFSKYYCELSDGKTLAYTLPGQKGLGFYYFSNGTSESSQIPITDAIWIMECSPENNFVYVKSANNFGTIKPGAPFTLLSSSNFLDSFALHKGSLYAIYKYEKLVKWNNATSEFETVWDTYAYGYKKREMENQPLDVYGFWNLDQNGDIYMTSSLKPLVKIDRSQRMVIQLIGNGTIDKPTFVSASYISDVFKDGTFMAPAEDGNQWYDPTVDKYFKTQFSNFITSDSTFTKDDDIFKGIEQVNYGGIDSLLVDCERDKYGYCLQNFTCYGILYNNEGACSGKGDCTDFDNCECYDNSSYSDCSFSCFGIKSDNETVCNGNGNCTEQDVCECNSWSTGMNCSEMIESQDGQNTTLANNSTNDFTNSSLSNNSTSENSTDFFNPTNFLNSSQTNTTYFGNYSSDSNSTQYDNSTKNNSTWNETNSTLNSTFFNSTTNSNTSFINETNFWNTTDNSTTMSNNTAITSNNTFTTHNNSVSNTTILNNSTIYNSTDLNADNVTVSNQTNLNSTIISNITISNNTNNKVQNSTNINNSTQIPIIQCYGYAFNDSRVCSGHGVCVSNNSCICSQLFEGSNCQTKKISCFGNFLTDPFVCSGHGSCTSEDTCQCKDGFIGSKCFAQISSPPNFNSMGNTLEFHFNTSFAISNSVLECKKIVDANSLSLLGNNPSCYWKDGNFFIELGGQYSILPLSNISLNVLALDDFNTQRTNFKSLIVQASNNPVKPIINVSYKNVISPCEEISIDASGSFCGDLKPVKFIWSIESSPDQNFNLQQVSFGDFNSTLKSSVSISGSYVFGLIVESSLSGSRSEKKLIEITKSSVPNPSLTLLTNKLSLINIEKSSLPVIVKKSIELPSCYFDNKEFKYSWEKLSGPSIEYNIDSNNDLIITGISSNGDVNYVFSVKAVSLFNSNSNASMLVPISSKSNDLSLNIYVSNLNINQVETIVEYSDPDNDLNNSDSWNWSCYDRVSNQLCQDSSVSNILTLCSISKSALCTIPKSSLSQISLTLSISKGVRSTSKSINIDYPVTQSVIPPVISLISVNPNRFKLLKDETLSLQLSVILGGDEKQTNEQDMIREWTINGNSLSSSMMSQMSTNPSQSSSLIISLSELLEDGEHEVILKVTDIRNGLSTTFSYKFKIVKSPKSCFCSINPSTGYALETQFSFSCPGCQNAEQSIDFIFGFIDDKSGTKIPLYNLGEKFASYLPSPYYASKLDTFVDIVDLDTGASVEFIKSVEIKTPEASSLTQVKIKVKGWQSYANSLPASASAKLIFNSATISRTSELMIARLSSNSRQPNDIAYELREEMLDSMILGFNQRNPLELLSDIHFRVFIFGLESLASNVATMNSLPFEKLFNITEKVINMANHNVKFRVADGVDKLCNSLIDSIMRILSTTGNQEKQSYVKRLFESMKKFNSLVLRNYYVGQKEYKVTLNHFSGISSLNYKNQLVKKSLTSDGNSTAIIDGLGSDISNRLVLETSMVSTIDFLGVSDILKQLTTNQKVKVSELLQFEVSTSYKLLSKIVTLDKKYNSELTIMFTIGNTYNMSNLNVENKIDEKIEMRTLECVPIDNILSQTNQTCITSISSLSVYCNCSKSVTSLIVIEKLISNSTLTQLDDDFPGDVVKKESNLALYGLFGLVGLVGLVALCCCGIIMIVVILVFCLRKKKKTNEVSKQKEVELLTV